MPLNLPSHTLDIHEEALIRAASQRLAWNEKAYGKAWSGEHEDTAFIVEPLLAAMRDLRSKRGVPVRSEDGDDG